MKSDKNFRLNKETKRMLALGQFASKEARNSFKRAMIDAQLSSEEAARRPVGASSKDKGD